MYGRISKFMNGIRQGGGNSLQQDQKKQDRFNGIEPIKVESYKTRTKSKGNNTVVKRCIGSSLQQDSEGLRDKAQASQKKNSVKIHEKN